MNKIYDEEFEFYANAVKLLKRTDFVWNLYFNLLCLYLEENNNQFPNDTIKYLGQNLGYWVARQRKKYNGNRKDCLPLLAEQIEKLKQINFPFDGVKSIELDNKIYLLNKFIKLNRRYPRHSELIDGVAIGKWFIETKKSYKSNKLSDKTVKKLESINFPFGNARKKTFRENFLLLQAFIESNHRLPKTAETYFGVKLGDWIDNQEPRFIAGKISEQEFTELKKLIAPFRLDRDAFLENRLNEIKHFYMQNNRLPTYSENENVQRWIKKIRLRFASNQLSSEVTKKILEITPFVLNDNSLSIALNNDSFLENRLNEIKYFYDQNNRLPSYSDNKRIRAWITKIRLKSDRKKLSDKTIKRILEVVPSILNDLTFLEKNK